ncbi:DUF5071 domain-containing protein [Paenibacillus sp. HN-1]|uniref:DUF5071 domain-containing protein n=1 Tax=Paenibacillus TaxID=44249 RepID=UPI001CA886AD|nr:MULTISPECIES: DUF5071 domain-containing protein [Paenibacillus]MBY9081798.1 DUF5071 domain-containing protein [Paenibacillus sp. CGMCC 1.18879]MBY9086517.1 DUF5071 domain-containing protein [Paenibacillus sinensis]
MEDLTKYLPRDKHDFESVAVLKNVDKSITITLIPQLLEWLQDMNWPIAQEVAKLLLQYPEETVPHVKAVLQMDDDIWKEWCLRYFVQELPVELFACFKSDLIRISSNPTPGEVLEEVHETAKEILEIMEERLK